MWQSHVFSLYFIVAETVGCTIHYLPELREHDNGDISGETFILQEELYPFISILREHNIIVTAFYNHWLFENPRLM